MHRGFFLLLSVYVFLSTTDVYGLRNIVISLHLWLNRRAMMQADACRIPGIGRHLHGLSELL